MFCCFGGVRKKKKEKSEKPIQQVHNKKQHQEQTKIKLLVNNADPEKSNKSLIKHEIQDQHKDPISLHHRDSKIINPNSKNGKVKEIVENEEEFKQLKSNEVKQEILKEGNKETSLLVKQSILKGSSLVVEKEKGEDYGIENNETNAVDLKAHSKTLQLRFYDQGSIIQTPAISTFRYDTFLSHYFGEQQHNDILAQG